VAEIFPSKEPVGGKVSVLGRRDFAQTVPRHKAAGIFIGHLATVQNYREVAIIRKTSPI
jgi:hypothetical protein